MSMVRVVRLMTLMVLTAWLSACGGGGTSVNTNTAVVATEVWDGTTDSGTSNTTIQKHANGTFTTSGTWTFDWNGYHVTCPFSSGQGTLSGNTFSFTASGTATTPQAPQGYQSSPFTLTSSGSVVNGQATGTFTVTFSTYGWPGSLGGSFTSSRSSGSGVTPDSAVLAPPSWLQGTWSGGSPTVLTLTFTSNNILNSSNTPEFAGFVETVKTDTDYHLKNVGTGEQSEFTKISPTQMIWWTTNGSLTNSTTMNKN